VKQTEEVKIPQPAQLQKKPAEFVKKELGYDDLFGSGIV
jgi:hypothetical protein